MDNATIADSFSLLSRLMDINGDNSFKSKTYSIAAFNIEKLTVPLKDASPEALSSIRGFGESVRTKVLEMLETGALAVLSEYISKTPPGVIEMLNIKGIGPKKINIIWKEMGIESIGELLYACDENRLMRFKGFGEKTQLNVQEGIAFYFSNQGHFLFAQLEEVVPQIENYLSKLFGEDNIKLTGHYLRHSLTIEELEFVVKESNEAVKPKFLSAHPPELLEEKEDSLLYKLKNGLKLRLYTSNTNLVGAQFKRAADPLFIKAFEDQFPGINYHGNDETIFAQAGISYIPPYLRETKEILDRAISGNLPNIIETPDIRGIIHSHSNWSDGTNSIEEMADECIRRGLSYLVISDHSQTASYAQGLKPERVIAQHQLIDQLNLQFAGRLKIFKSIESDILNDGSLDYTEDILKTFDLVIASVHSNLKMNEEKAMVRLLKAIENPYTSILGHPTGRLLLSRNGYPIDHLKIIDACAANNVVIELNAHPRRLDIDWKWISYAMEKEVMISINPDAHFLSGFDDIKYGVLAAQKGGLEKEKNLSSFELPEFESWMADLRLRKNAKILTS